MAEMMVNLMALPDLSPILEEQRAKGIEIRQGQESEKKKITNWVREYCNPNWAIACEDALDQIPVTCYIAIEKEPSDQPTYFSTDLPNEKLIGFACYDVTNQGVLGPICVLEDHEKSNIETALLLVCLHAMAGQNYKSAVIGWGSFIDGFTGSEQKNK